MALIGSVEVILQNKDMLEAGIIPRQILYDVYARAIDEVKSGDYLNNI